MLKTRDKTCARRCRSGHPVRNRQIRDVTKPHYRGGCAAYRKRCFQAPALFRVAPIMAARLLGGQGVWCRRGHCTRCAGWHGEHLSPPFPATCVQLQTGSSTARGWWPAWAGAQNQQGTRHGTGRKYIRKSVFISLYELFLFCPHSAPALPPLCPHYPAPR